MIYKIWLTLSLFSLFPLTAHGKKLVNVAVGTIKETKGAPDILRNPADILDIELKKRSKKEGFTIALYKGKYWQSYKIEKGSKIYYGDVLASGPDTKMVLKMQDGYKIILDRNTRIRVTKSFINSNKLGFIRRWLHILGGTIRANIQKDLKKNQSHLTDFRSNTISLGVRGTDFIFSRDDSKSRVYIVEGQVAVKDVSPEQNAAFEKLSQEEGEKNLSEHKEALKILEKESLLAEMLVKKGQFVEALAPPAAEILDSMPELQKQKLLSQNKIKSPRTITAKEISEIKAITHDFAIAEDLKERKAVSDLEKELEQDKNPKPPQKYIPFAENFSLSLGMGDGEYHTNIHGNRRLFKTEPSIILGFSYYLYPCLSFDLGFGGSQWLLEDWERATGASHAEGDEIGINMSYLGIAAHQRFGDLRIGARLGFTPNSKNMISYTFSKSGEEYREWDISYDISSSMKLALRIDWSFASGWSVFGEYTSNIGSKTIKVESVIDKTAGSNQDISDSQNFKSAILDEKIRLIGISWFFL